MYSFYHSFVHLLFISIIALFPVVNPIGSAFIISPYLTDLNLAEKKRAVGTITLYAFSICTVCLFAGQWILELFGISIPIVQLAGGIMICKMGWENLTSDKTQGDDASDADHVGSLSGYSEVEKKLFYPITFPVTTGAGTISVLFTLSAHSETTTRTDYYLNTGAILSAIIVICILIYIFYLNTKRIIHYMGSNAEVMFNRISAFLIFCVGLQIAITGLKTLFKM